MRTTDSSGAAIPAWDVGDRMKKALRHAGMGAQEMADYLGVSRTSVSAWINGRVRPSTQTLRLWALTCNVSYYWLTDTKPEFKIHLDETDPTEGVRSSVSRRLAVAA